VYTTREVPESGIAQGDYVMSQQSDLPQQPMQKSKKLLQRIGCLGSLGVFSSSMAIAAQPSPTASIAPSVVVPAESVPDPTPPAFVASPSPSAIAIPERQEPEPPVEVVIEQRNAAPVQSAADPVPPAVASPAPVIASPAPKAPAYEAPDSVVFSERNSGCQFAVTQGKTVAEACGTPASPKPIANNDPAGLSKVVSNMISGTVRPKFAPTAATTTPSEAPISVAPVQVGPVSLGSSGVSYTPSTVTPPSAFVQNYYNRTARPLGLPGNGNVSLMFPISIPSAITSLFGWRIHPISGSARMHTGTDIGADMGTPVLAALSGRVIMADFFGGYGLSIALEHKDGTQQTLYAHLSEIFVRPGDVINQGTVIGRVGSTGASTGPHLHFEFRQQLQDGGWVAQDPGFALEQALAQLTKSLHVGQAAPKIPQPAKSNS
jgi:murein DD-endopeptidase MepM/ murein hydrolase activator NlpD